MVLSFVFRSAVFDLPGLKLLDEVAVRRGLLLRPRTDEPLREERQHDDDQDREGGALEEPAHGELTGASSALRGETDTRASVPAFIRRPARLPDMSRSMA